MNKNFLIGIVECIEKVIISILLFSLLFVVLYSSIVFLGLLFKGITSQYQNSFTENNILTHLHKIFGGFMMVLIGVELVHTVKMYLKEDVVHVEIVLLVALIGISRHVIDLDFKALNPLTIIGISSLIIVLSLGYYLIKKGMGIKRQSSLRA
ncbi:hypothetical protein A9Q87_02605 [Flavobacteriales bacterium 34_180_T64]|nr:hypothetical protein A9Q87_02605 [Flavobacteriales bacterium 34_180_T64]